MKKITVFIFLCFSHTFLSAQTQSSRNSGPDGTNTTAFAALEPGTVTVEPGYGIKFITNPDGALKTANRSIKLDATTNQAWITTNYQYAPTNFPSYGGTSQISNTGTLSNQTYINTNSETNLSRNFPLPVTGNVYITNLNGPGADLLGISIRDITNPAILHKTITPDNIGEIDFDIFAATTQTDGKILLAGRCVFSQGRMVIIRLNTDYTFDTTFNTTGFVKLPFGSDCQARAIALQPSGKIIVAGHRIAPGSVGVVARLNTNGTLDTTFGDAGSKLFNYEVWTQNNTFNLTDQTEVYAMYVSISGNIYLGGVGSSSGLWGNKSIPCFHGLTSNGNDWLVMRDESHTTATSIFNIQGGVYKMIALPDGGLLLGGLSKVADNFGLYLQKFDAVGNVDTGFHFKTGAQESFYDLSPQDDIIHDLALQNDGKILAVGESDSKGFYTRLEGVVLGTDHFENPDLSAVVFPNPVKDYLNISIKNAGFSKIDVCIYDMTGKVAGNFKDLPTEGINVGISVSGLAKGIYIIKIIQGNSATALRFVKE